MIDLILTNNINEAKEYIAQTFLKSPTVKTHIVSHTHQIEGLRGPFVLHFMPSWDEIPYANRVDIIDWVNRETIIQLGLAEQRGRELANEP